LKYKCPACDFTCDLGQQLIEHFQTTVKQQVEVQQVEEQQVEEQQALADAQAHAQAPAPTLAAGTEQPERKANQREPGESAIKQVMDSMHVNRHDAITELKAQGDAEMEIKELSDRNQAYKEAAQRLKEQHEQEQVAQTFIKQNQREIVNKAKIAGIICSLSGETAGGRGSS
jgi:hypothetical protein